MSKDKQLAAEWEQIVERSVDPANDFLFKEREAEKKRKQAETDKRGVSDFFQQFVYGTGSKKSNNMRKQFYK